MVGNTPKLTLPSTGTVAGEVLYVPLEFWFNRNAGLALPLIALQYHEVKVNIEFRDKSDCYWSSAPVTVGDFDECSLFVDYIYLDTDERRRFAQVSHEYLIEQLQYTGDETTSTSTPKIKLNFNHPVKELVWVVQPDKFTSGAVDSYKGKQWFNFTDDWDTTYSSATFGNGSNLVDPLGSNDAGAMPGVAAGGANNVLLPVSFESGVNPVSRAKLQLNGHDRFSERDGRYFNLVQPYQHHENVPKAGINVYSFALKPEEHQPSGTCNMSRIDNATLQLFLTNKIGSSDTAKVRVYAVSYNVLRIMSGMGGLKIRAIKFRLNIATSLMNNIRRNSPLFGKLLRTSCTKFVMATCKWLRKSSDMVKIKKILQWTTRMQYISSYFRDIASETERELVIVNQSLKIQSIPESKDNGIRVLTATRRYILSYFLFSSFKNNEIYVWGFDIYTVFILYSQK